MFFQTIDMWWWVCACASDLFLFYLSFFYNSTAHWFVCVSLLLFIYHLLSIQEMCEKKIIWKGKGEREREWGRGRKTQTYRQRKTKEKASSIVIIATAVRCHFWHVSRRTYMYTQLLLRRRAYIRATHRVKLAVN